jgi:hypothetical protein
MRKPVFRIENELEWRTLALLEIVHLRCAIFELGLLIAIIAIGASTARWWDGAPVVAAVITLLGAAFCYSERRSTARVRSWPSARDNLLKHYFKCQRGGYACRAPLKSTISDPSALR